MADKKNTVINGFVFDSEAEAAQAEKEAEGVRYIREKMDMNQPEQVLQIYNKMVQQNLFETAVGFVYLNELREYLRTNPAVRNEDIAPVTVKHPALEADLRKKIRTPAVKNTKKKKETKTTVKDVGYRTKYRVTLFFTVVLAVSVVGMFAVASTIGSPTILNYENKLIDKYAAWEQELEEREAELNERERALP